MSLNVRIANALTIDVEDYFHASALGIPMATWDAQEQRAARNTSELLALLDEAGVRATFFVLGWVGERHPELVAEIAAAGHEVACHGYSHELIYNQTPAVFAEETRRAKHVLEDILGSSVLGYRAASFSIVERSRWALDILAELGFSYDSSIFPVRHDRYGIPDAELAPHVLRLGNGRRLVEVPPSVLPLGPFRLPVAGGGYFRLFPYALTRWAIAQINRRGCPAVVYLHPWEIDPGQPRADVGAVTRFRHYVNIDKVAGRLRRAMAEFRFLPMRDLVKQLEVGRDPTLVRPGAAQPSRPA